MIHTLLGPERFRAGSDLYFERHDGQAVTTDDFVACMEAAGSIDLTQFKRWYSQAGTPTLTVSRAYDEASRTLALTIAGLVLFIVANTFPFLAMKSGGLVRETTLITGIKGLYLQGMEALALLVLLTSILVPFVQIAGMLYVLVPLKVNRLPRKLALVYRFIRSLQPWGMMEVFMLGILVSFVKLAKMASLIPGIALYAFLVLIFILAASANSTGFRVFLCQSSRCLTGLRKS